MKSTNLPHLLPREFAYRHAVIDLEIRTLTILFLLKAGFRPEQPRVPAGSRDGGRWVGEGSGSRPTLISRRGPRGAGQVRIAGRWQPVTPAQEARLAVSIGQMREALRAVHRREPNWKPTPQAYETVEGMIRANEFVAQEAMLRALQLKLPRTGLGPYAKDWIVAPQTNRRLTKAEQAEIDRIGRTYGCHWCGITTSGTRRGHFIGDHQVPKSISKPSRIFHTAYGAAIHRADLYRTGDFDSMIVQHLSITPEYVSFYVAGRRNVDIPLHMDRKGVLSSNDCINIPALYWNDGDTHVTLGPSSEITHTGTPDFDGILDTPNQEFILFDAIEPQFAIVQVPSVKTRIRVWIDHPIEPENVIIAWG